MSRNMGKRRYFSTNLNAKKKKSLFMEIGYRGFIVTCNGNEKQCIRESYNILNEYADKLYGPENVIEKSKTGAEEDELDKFDKEVKSMAGERRFSALDTTIANCIFIKTNLADPEALAESIMSDLFETKQKKARFILRFVPVSVTCKAYLEDIKIAAATLFDKYFKGEPTTFSIIFNRRSNSNVDRDSVIKELAEMVDARNKEHKVNLKNSKLTIMVEVIKNICCLSVIRNYFDYCKYNLESIAIIVEHAEDEANKETISKGEALLGKSDAENEANEETISKGETLLGKSDAEVENAENEANEETISKGEALLGKSDAEVSEGDRNDNEKSKVESLGSSEIEVSKTEI